MPFWFLRHCTQVVLLLPQWSNAIIGDTTSSPRSVDFGVPQGSILGPILFSLYVAPPQDIVATYRLDSMFYADDSQLYIAINPNDSSPALDTL